MSAKTLMARSYVLSGTTSNPLFMRMRQSVPFFARLRPTTSPWLGTASRSFIWCSREIHGRAQSVVNGGFGFNVGRRKIFTSNTIRAAHVNDAGSIDSPLINSMEIKIKEHLNAESVSVKDAYGDGRHVSIDVVSSSFEGQSAVNRQRMVYKAIWEELQSTVHAVDQMTTKTPNEVATEQ